jgi:hypothetical protein
MLGFAWAAGDSVNIVTIFPLLSPADKWGVNVSRGYDAKMAEITHTAMDRRSDINNL